MSQPSLSQQIHKLEEELNQQLFDRLPRSVVLTAAGTCLLPYAKACPRPSLIPRMPHPYLRDNARVRSLEAPKRRR